MISAFLSYFGAASMIHNPSSCLVRLNCLEFTGGIGSGGGGRRGVGPEIKA